MKMLVRIANETVANEVAAVGDDEEPLRMILKMTLYVMFILFILKNHS